MENTVVNLADYGRYRQDLNSGDTARMIESLNMILHDMLQGKCLTSIFVDIIRCMSTLNINIQTLAYQILMLWSQYGTQEYLVLCLKNSLFYFIFFFIFV